MFKHSTMLFVLCHFGFLKWGVGERKRKEGVIELNCFDLCSVIIKTKKFNESGVRVCVCVCAQLSTTEWKDS